MMAFFYLSANFLALVVTASSLKTSKGTIFFPVAVILAFLSALFS